MTYDVLVAGSGPVGATLALALSDTGLAVGLIGPSAAARAFRPVALAHATRTWLGTVAPALDIDETSIESIHVSQQHRFGRTVLEAREHGLPALGHVCDLGELAAALLARAQRWHIPGRVTAHRRDGEHIQVVTERSDGSGSGPVETLRAALLVRADGGAAASLRIRHYGQIAITARVQPEDPMRGRAFERFTPEGPLALLPCGDGAALVWATSAARAAALVEGPAETFLAALADSFGSRLGRFVAVSGRSATPLALTRDASVAEPRVIVIGNAAQTLHPVAGQGLNLGLRDCAELARLLVARPARALDAAAIGHITRTFERLRRPDRSATMTVTDSLVRLFSTDSRMLGIVRGVGLAALDLIPPARILFARRMMLGARGFP